VYGRNGSGPVAGVRLVGQVRLADVRLVKVTFELPTQRSGDLPGDRQDQICGAQLGKPRCTKGIMEGE
jgi:hypothetical protein